MRKSTHTSEYALLRERLLALRTAAALSQRDLAAILGVPHSWVAKVESGERRIDLVEFAWFCRGCGAAPVDVAHDLLAHMSPAALRAGRAQGRRP